MPAFHFFQPPVAIASAAALALVAWSNPVAAAAELPASAAPGRASPWLEPDEIDRAVIAFTGAAIGEIGGARAAADPRLRLAACKAPLSTSWHGQTRAAVKVECRQTRSGAQPWRIFVATRPADQPSGSVARRQPAAKPARIIKRGDPITVVVRGRGFTVQQAGEAMEPGALGDWIAIRTARQAEPVRARIERPGLAIIPVG